MKLPGAYPSRQVDHQSFPDLLAVIGGTLMMVLTGQPSIAGQFVWDFSTNPTSGALPLRIGGNGVNPGEWQTSGGNPGGFLALTWPVRGQVTTITFPNIDPGKVVTAFKFEADLRVGNSTGERAADGFSISFAREGDPILEVANAGNPGVFAGGFAEGGSTTGIAVSFDTWSGNTLPDGADIEGILVRVDNKTVLRQSLPTRHGACTDGTSLQTGPRTPDLWAGGVEYTDPSTYTQLCWQPFSVELTEAARLTVRWKGRAILENLQTSYFPTASQLVLAGRTGDANEHAHLDNIRLTTTATGCANPPSTPSNLRVIEAGSRRASLSWSPSTIAGDPTAPIGYVIQMNGATVSEGHSGVTFESRDLNPSTRYVFSVRARNVCGNVSPAASIPLTTLADVDNLGFLQAQVFRTSLAGASFTGSSQADLDRVLADPKYPNNPDSIYLVNGFQFGEPNFGDTFGENHLTRVAGILTAPKTGRFRFYLRADDAARVYLNRNGPALPNPLADTPIAQENGCCGGFEEPGSGNNGDGTFPTSEPIRLTQGVRYGLLMLVKEGGGGDWGQIGMREEGSVEPVLPITGSIVSGGKGDPGGAVVRFLAGPAAVTVTANQSTVLSTPVETSSPYDKPPFYQWYKNEVLIPGATAPSYEIPTVSPADAGRYVLEVGVVGLSRRGPAITVSVRTDTKPPVLLSSEGFGSIIHLQFDEPVRTNTGSFAISGGITARAVTRNGTSGLSLLVPELTSEAQYTVSVSGVQDFAGNTIASGSATRFTAWKFTPGMVRVQYFDGLNPSTLEQLKAVRTSGQAPSVEYMTNHFEAFANRAEGFGTVLGALIRPTISGDYVFYLSADDNAELWLSTDDNPSNLRRIAIEPSWNGNRDWVGTTRRNPEAPENRSDRYLGTGWPNGNRITLNEGSRYYLELISQEGGGGDNAAVLMKPAFISGPNNGDSPIAGPSIVGSYSPSISPVLSTPQLLFAASPATNKVYLIFTADVGTSALVATNYVIPGIQVLDADAAGAMVVLTTSVMPPDLTAQVRFLALTTSDGIPIPSETASFRTPPAPMAQVLRIGRTTVNNVPSITVRWDLMSDLYRSKVLSPLFTTNGTLNSSDWKLVAPNAVIHTESITEDPFFNLIPPWALGGASGTIAMTDRLIAMHPAPANANVIWDYKIFERPGNWQFLTTSNPRVNGIKMFSGTTPSSIITTAPGTSSWTFNGIVSTSPSKKGKSLQKLYFYCIQGSMTLADPRIWNQLP